MRRHTWFMIGSAPSVLSTLPIVEPLFPFGTTITCNSGIKLVPNPDYYVCVDQIASHNYHDAALEAQRAGTTLVTLNRNERARRERRIEHFNLFLNLQGHGVPTRSRYGPFRYTGPLCLEFACHHGAKCIYILGMDGYRKQNDYFDPDQPRKCVNTWTDQASVTIEACNRIARVWRDVEFIQYGDPIPEFRVSSPNWTLRKWMPSHTSRQGLAQSP